jgi:hypothetical protein
LHHLEFGEWVESRSVLDITSGDFEAGAVPWAGDTSIASDDTLNLRERRSDSVYRCSVKKKTYHGSSVVCAVRRHCMKAILGLDEQDLAALNTLDLILSLLAVLEVDAGQALELVFTSHLAEGAGEVCSLGVQVCWQLCNRLTEETRCVTEGGEHRRRRRDVCMVVGWKWRRSYLVRDYCTSLPASTTWAAWACLRADDIEVKDAA